MLIEVQSLAQIIELNTRLFRNCLAGVSPEEATQQVVPETNNIIFLGAHLVDARFYMAGMFGYRYDEPFPELADVRSIAEMKPPGPSLDRILKAWSEIEMPLRQHLDQATPVELASECTVGFPIPNATVFSAVTFLVQHESYHIGQLGLLRKLVGLSPMSYE